MKMFFMISYLDLRCNFQLIWSISPSKRMFMWIFKQFRIGTLQYGSTRLDPTFTKFMILYWESLHIWISVEKLIGWHWNFKIYSWRRYNTSVAATTFPKFLKFWTLLLILSCLRLVGFLNSVFPLLQFWMFWGWIEANCFLHFESWMIYNCFLSS